jgi:rare lipoprotein A (peptidoglycan hydrolase)
MIEIGRRSPMRKILLLLIMLISMACSAQLNAATTPVYKSVEEKEFRVFSSKPEIKQDKPIAVLPAQTKPPIPKIVTRPKIVTKPKASITNSSTWILDSNISWYGPGFYGHRTACGLELTKTLIGVAHRTLKCGTIITFKWDGISISAPVVDRGPYVTGRQFDMTGGLCVKLNHCFTGKIYYRIDK